jgi:putative ABC transport system substrate-binding protein
MRRHKFIAGLGGAVAWPLAARAQHINVPVIAYLGPTSPKDSPPLPAFLQGLKQTGFVEGQNVATEYRRGEGRNNGLPALAADLVGRRVAVIAAIGPAAAQLALLVNPTNLPAGGLQAQAAARELRWEFEIFGASTEEELDAAFKAMAKQTVGAVNVVPDTFFTNRRAQIVALATGYGIPSSYYFRDFVIVGGLVSYGADFREPSRLAGNYVGRILKGETPAEQCRKR